MAKRLSAKSLAVLSDELRAVAERDEARAKLTKCQLAYEWCHEGRAIAERERDEALMDARRYRWLRQRNPDALATIAWCCKEACQYPDPDRAIDAAIKAEETP